MMKMKTKTKATERAASIRSFGRSLAAVLLLLLCGAGTVNSQARNAMPQEKPYVVEYYYKVKWGHQDEFLSLFRKNHLPLLRKQVESGRLISVEIMAPRYHTPEEHRWDYRVTIVFRNAERAMEGDPADLIRQMYPDQATFKREEQRRFEILDAHWDLPVLPVSVEEPQN